MIISLVRSNEIKKCGFLGTSNRINVLLRYNSQPEHERRMLIPSLQPSTRWDVHFR